MTMADFKPPKGMTPTAALIAIALGGYWFLQRDVRAEMVAQRADLAEHINVTKAAVDRNDANDVEVRKILSELRDIARETCIHSAKTPEQIHGCLYPGQR